MSAFQSDSEFSIDLGGAIPSDLGRRIKWAAPVVGLVLLFVLLAFLRSVYTDLLWFGEVGFRAVYVKILVTRIVLFLAGAVLAGIPLGLSLYFANRASRGPEEVPPPAGDARLPGGADPLGNDCGRHRSERGSRRDRRQPVGAVLEVCRRRFIWKSGPCLRQGRLLLRVQSSPV